MRPELSIPLIVIILAIVIVVAKWAYVDFPKECTAHGGAHVTHPYKSFPECWRDDGRRVFW